MDSRSSKHERRALIAVWGAIVLFCGTVYVALGVMLFAH